MEIHDLRALVGPVPAVDADAVSVLTVAQPLVVRVEAAPDEAVVAEAAARLAELPTVTVLAGDPDVVPRALVATADLCVTDQVDPPAPWVHAGAGTVTDAVGRQPGAALALVALLRSASTTSVWDGIVAEAVTYGLLLGSAGFRDWLDTRLPPARPATRGPRVRLTRHDDRLLVELDRPHVHNAIDTVMRDELVAALRLPLVDPTITAVQLTGRGPSFSSGGDLDEFGMVGDPATSLAVRLTRHPGYAIHRIADRTTAHLHGSCIGAGVEVPAFAHRVTADPEATLRLPELSMGLIPGAGGTVSVRRRIGRHRTAWLALSGESIDATTAVTWGLVDAVEAWIA